MSNAWFEEMQIEVLRNVQNELLDKIAHVYMPHFEGLAETVKELFPYAFRLNLLELVDERPFVLKVSLTELPVEGKPSHTAYLSYSPRLKRSEVSFSIACDRDSFEVMLKDGATPSTMRNPHIHEWLVLCLTKLLGAVRYHNQH